MTPTTVPLGCLPPNTVFGMAPPPCRWAIILSVATFKACPFRVKRRRGRQADGTAGLPSVPEIAEAFRHLRFVPISDIVGLV
jgi:hypothetical protein